MSSKNLSLMHAEVFLPGTSSNTPPSQVIPHIPRGGFQPRGGEHDTLSGPPSLVDSRIDAVHGLRTSGQYSDRSGYSRELKELSLAHAVGIPSAEQLAIFDHFCKFSFMRSHLSRVLPPTP